MPVLKLRNRESVRTEQLTMFVMKLVWVVSSRFLILRAVISKEVAVFFIGA